MFPADGRANGIKKTLLPFCYGKKNFNLSFSFPFLRSMPSDTCFFFLSRSACKKHFNSPFFCSISISKAPKNRKRDGKKKVLCFKAQFHFNFVFDYSTEIIRQSNINLTLSREKGAMSEGSRQTKKGVKKNSCMETTHQSLVNKMIWEKENDKKNLSVYSVSYRFS